MRTVPLAFLTSLLLHPAPAASQTAASAGGVEVWEASIPELADAMAAGRATSAGLVDAYLARIAAYDHGGPALNAVIRLNPEARAQAAALDRERRERGPRGPLHGIPVLVKDNYEVAGLVTANGSIAFAGWIPERDADVVRRLREAGAVVLGMTNMHELASGITTIGSAGGQTHNPYDPSRNPGGSSGGTGAAVAASFAALGWGSDTCGSIRIPASHQNLFGLRPTADLFSVAGIFPLSHTQDVPGPLARTVTDLAIGLDATLPDGAPFARGRFQAALDGDALRGLKVGLLADASDDAPEAREVTRALEPALDTLKARGVEVVEITAPELDSLASRSNLIGLEHKWDLIDFLSERPDADVRDMTGILEGSLYHLALENTNRAKDTLNVRDSERYRAALAARRAFQEALLRVMDERALDVIVYPTMRRKPATIGERQYGTTCALSAQTGYPAITMPAGFTDDGLPVGLEALGRPLDDDRLVGIAYAFERALQPRRAPYSTPPLVDGRAPAPPAFVAEARGADGERVTARFSWDVTRSALDYAVRVESVPSGTVHAVTLNLIEDRGRGPVVELLLPNGGTSAEGTLTLSAAARRALEEGRLALALYTHRHPEGVFAPPIALP